MHCKEEFNFSSSLYIFKSRFKQRIIPNFWYQTFEWIHFILMIRDTMAYLQGYQSRICRIQLIKSPHFYNTMKYRNRNMKSIYLVIQNLFFFSYNWLTFFYIQKNTRNDKRRCKVFNVTFALMCSKIHTHQLVSTLSHKNIKTFNKHTFYDTSFKSPALDWYYQIKAGVKTQNRNR